MIQNMPKACITIPVGGMYQEWICLMDLVEEDTAKNYKKSMIKKLSGTLGTGSCHASEYRTIEQETKTLLK